MPVTEFVLHTNNKIPSPQRHVFAASTIAKLPTTRFSTLGAEHRDSVSVGLVRLALWS